MKIILQVVILAGSFLVMSFSQAAIVKGKIRQIYNPGAGTARVQIMIEGTTTLDNCLTEASLINNVQHVAFFLNNAIPTLYTQNVAVLTAAKLNGSVVVLNITNTTTAPNNFCEITSFFLL